MLGLFQYLKTTLIIGREILSTNTKVVLHQFRTHSAFFSTTVTISLPSIKAIYSGILSLPEKNKGLIVLPHFVFARHFSRPLLDKLIIFHWYFSYKSLPENATRMVFNPADV